MTREGPGLYRSADGKYTLRIAEGFSLCRSMHETPKGTCVGMVEHPYAYWEVLDREGVPLLNPLKRSLLTRFDLVSA